MKHYKRLTYEVRVQIQTFLEKGVKPYKIAQMLKVSNSSIYREIEQGTVNGLYSAKHSHEKALRTRSTQGRKHILKLNSDLAQRISHLISVENLSPKQVVERLREEHYPDAPASYTTIYSAIDAGLIPNVTRENLQRKETHMFSNRLLKIPEWICKELDLKDGEPLNIDIEDNKIVIRKADNNAIEK